MTDCSKCFHVEVCGYNATGEVPDSCPWFVPEVVPCGSERPQRKTICQLPKGHKGSHVAVIYWE